MQIANGQPRCWVSCLGLLLAATLATVCQAQGTVRSDLVQIGQETTTATISEVRSAGEWFTPEGPLDVGRIVRFGGPRLIREDGVIALDDGSTLVAKELRTEGTTLHAYNRLWDEMAIPLRPIRGLLLRAYLDPDETRRALDRIQAYEGTQDRLLLANGDSVEGTFRRLSALDVEFQMADRALKLDRKRVLEIHFAAALRHVPRQEPGVWVGLDDGTLLLAQQLQLSDDRLTVRLPVGIELTSSPLENAFQFLTYLRPQAGTDAAGATASVQYLSDLEPISFKGLGFLSTEWNYQDDRDVLGGTLKSDRYVSQKGLGMHATARIAYRVPTEATRFRAKVGIDDGTNGLGSVIFRVYTSQTGNQWKPVYESPTVRGGDFPRDVDVPLEDAKGIALVVEFADGADVLDHANWLDARFESE